MSATWLLCVGAPPAAPPLPPAGVRVHGTVPCRGTVKADGTASIDWTAERTFLERHLPTGLTPVGLHVDLTSADAASSAATVARTLHAASAAQMAPAGTWIVACELRSDVAGRAPDVTVAHALSPVRRRPDAGTTAVVEDERGWSLDAEGGSATAILARLAGSYTATWTIERPELAAWTDRPLVHFVAANVLLPPAATGGRGSARCGDVFATTKGSLPSPVEARLLRTAGASEGPATALDAPTITWPTGNASVQVRTAALGLDVLAVATADETVGTLARRLEEGARRQAVWLAAEATAKDGAVSVPTVYHFRPFAQAPWLPALVLFPFTEPSVEAVHGSLRRALHERLGLPLDRPRLRLAQAERWTPATSTTTSGRAVRLRDVHLHAKPSDLTGGRQYLVDGSYDYYHYMQDGINDNGWGCSYRSFQTLCSWFVRQQYAAGPVPLHREMQQTLVNLRDKPPSFVGSREWIGSVELSLLLDHYYEASCRIIHMSSGAEFPSKASEIARHFETEGTPIMIGGGVLAYTLLGIDWNRETGGTRYLILDPHYTGADDVSTVIAKGWCAWKPASLFNANVFYNLCLPLRPRTL